MTVLRAGRGGEECARVCVCVSFTCTLYVILYVNNINPHDCIARDRDSVVIYYIKSFVCTFFFFFLPHSGDEVLLSPQSFPPCILLVSLAFNCC